MSRLSALVAKFEEENTDSGFDSTYSRARLGDNSYAPNNQASDSESISEGSRKIRKKRDVYHKIPDDIRVKLLEAVQSGETLKSAAKRYKINYSSAKSILHTYRKEGRILKKSAQERTTKKKVIAYTDSEPAELTKSSKKEHTKTGENNRKAVAPLAERIITTTTCASQNEESNPSDLNNGLSDNLVSILKMEHYENRLEDSKALTKPPMLHVSYPNMTQEDHANPLEAFGNNRTPRQKGGKLFDNFYVNYSDFHFPEVGDFHGNEDFTSNMFHTNEFDPFSDVMSALQPKGQKNEDAYADTNTYFYPKGFNSGYNFEEKNGKAENAGTYEENLENTGNPLKSFMDTQKLFQDAVRKVNFFNGSGNQGFRKSSFDLF